MTEQATPRTDKAAIGFARVLVDKETFTVTEIIPADFARQLESELSQAIAQRGVLIEALKDAQAFIASQRGTPSGEATLNVIDNALASIDSGKKDGT
jgi:hypothetical protein